MIWNPAGALTPPFRGAARQSRRALAQGPGLGGAHGGEVGGQERGAAVLRKPARGEGGVVDEQRAVGGETADLDSAAAERVEPPVRVRRIGRLVHPGDQHGERGAAVPVGQPHLGGQRGLGQPEPDQRAPGHGHRERRRAARRPRPLAGEQAYALPVEGGEQRQIGTPARGGGARQAVRAAARQALDADREPAEQLAGEAPYGRVVLGARRRGVLAGDQYGGPVPARPLERLAQPGLAHAAREGEQRRQDGRGDQHGEQYGGGERQSPAQPAHDEAEHVPVPPPSGPLAPDSGRCCQIRTHRGRDLREGCDG